MAQSNQQAIIARVCQYIEDAETEHSLDDLARYAGFSRFYFHKLFKKYTGMTPKAYSNACKKDKMQQSLADGERISDAIYQAGFNSNGRFYEKSKQILGMTPTSFQNKGQGATIKFAIGQCMFGAILVAATDAGICAIYLDDEADTLINMLQDAFPKANLIGADAAFDQWVSQVVGFVENKHETLALPLDIQGTVFQRTVWQALCKIPIGQTVSYQEIARMVGKPKAVRAVANAIASNNHAVAIPCHRVVRVDGEISGYRWAVSRKKALLDYEIKHNEAKKVE